MAANRFEGKPHDDVSIHFLVDMTCRLYTVPFRLGSNRADHPSVTVISGMQSEFLQTYVIVGSIHYKLATLLDKSLPKR